MTSYDLRTRKDDPAVFEDPMLLSDTAARDLLRPAPWRRFAVIGDSIAAGTGDPAPGFAMLPWADRLAGWLRAAHPEARYLNTGRMGATLGEIRAEQLATLHEFHPDLVFVNGGGNDLMRREADLGAVEQDLDQLCAEATATGARLALFTLADAFTGPLQPLRPRFAAFAEAVRRVAARHDAILVEFWGHPARLRPDWLSADRIHLTMAGQAIVAAELAKSLARHADSGPGSG
ncbi:SGNH/GDSL hydrolase family protein [Nocardia sp. NBC_01327]|uniref:SGNH/GDSL hydrolase family protein n=1 Tax=Nocardia sp. NBC_01327 TaxID=2903593 RepID=UPI002E15345B|nr:SGNH/GDSL hydrolase family protein [Nocardia sp. NBC_01327]